MASLTAFLPLVKAYAPAVPNPVAEQYLRLAAREFCVETRCWRDLLTITVAANPFAIAPAYTSVVAIQQAMFGDRDITPGILSDMKINELDETGEPDRLLQIAEDTFRLHPFKAGDLKVLAYLAPQSGPQFGSDGSGGTHQANQLSVPDALFNDHAQAIASGALAHIHTLPNQSYLSAEHAALHAGWFASAKNRIRGKEITGKQRAPIRTKSVFF